jgi:hypothetical protein
VKNGIYLSLPDKERLFELLKEICKCKDIEKCDRKPFYDQLLQAFWPSRTYMRLYQYRSAPNGQPLAEFHRIRVQAAAGKLFQCSSSVPTGPMAKFSTSQVVI